MAKSDTSCRRNARPKHKERPVDTTQPRRWHRNVVWILALLLLPAPSHAQCPSSPPGPCLSQAPWEWTQAENCGCRSTLYRNQCDLDSSCGPANGCQGPCRYSCHITVQEVCVSNLEPIGAPPPASQPPPGVTG